MVNGVGDLQIDADAARFKVSAKQRDRADAASDQPGGRYLGNRKRSKMLAHGSTRAAGEIHRQCAGGGACVMLKLPE